MKTYHKKSGKQFSRVVGLSGGMFLAASIGFANTAMAAETGRSSLEEVVVTAQFREQSVQETPLAITAVNAAIIEARGYENITDLSDAAPNVSFVESAGLNSGNAAYIRGVGQYESNIALEPGVGTYIDDVYYGAMAGANIGLLDLDRAEILRGPQGTLAGANSIGGAVKLYTKKPTGDGGGYFEAGFGSNETYTMRGAFDTTLIKDKLFMRVSAGSKSAGGYVDRVDFVCENPTQAGNFQRVGVDSTTCKFGSAGGKDSISARLALRWLPSDDLEINVSADTDRTDSEAPPYILTYVGTIDNHYNNGGFSPFGYTDGQVQKHGIPYDDRYVPGDGEYKNYATYNDPDRTGVSYSPNGYADNSGFAATIDYQITDTLSLKSITGHRSSDIYGTADTDGSPASGAHESYFWDISQWTQEFRLNGESFDDALEWTLGAYYYESDQNQTGLVNAQTALAFAGGLFFLIDDTAESEKKAVFATGIFHATEDLTITAGVRYSESTFDYSNTRTEPVAFPPGVVTFFGLTALADAPQQSTSRPDYRLSFSYQINDGFMTYAQYATGFKDGGINPTATSPDTQTVFGEEDLESYEIGFKSDLLDNTLRLNMAAFYSDYTELQISAVALDNGGNLSAVTTNVGEATMKGLELEVEWLPIADLLVILSASYLDFEYGDLGAAANEPNGPCASCTNLYTPETSGYFAIQYAFDLGNNGTVTPRISTDYQSKVYTNASNKETSAIDARWVSNASLTWESVDEDWKAVLKVNNLFDEYYFTQMRSAEDNLGMNSGLVARPREFMLSLKKTF